MKRRVRRVAVLAAAALLIPFATLLVTAGPAQAAGPTATFIKVSEWDGGFTGQYTISNAGPAAINGWTLEFDLPAGTAMGAYWDVLVTRTGDHYTARNREYNGTVAAGASVRFGFVGTGGGTPAN